MSWPSNGAASSAARAGGTKRAPAIRATRNARLIMAREIEPGGGESKAFKAVIARRAKHAEAISFRGLGIRGSRLLRGVYPWARRRRDPRARNEELVNPPARKRRARSRRAPRWSRAPQARPAPASAPRPAPR